MDNSRNKYTLTAYSFVFFCVVLICLFCGCSTGGDNDSIIVGDDKHVKEYYSKVTVAESGKFYLASTGPTNVTVEAGEGTFKSGTEILLTERDLESSEFSEFEINSSRVYILTGNLYENGIKTEILETKKPVTITIPNPFSSDVNEFYLGFKPEKSNVWQYTYLGNSFNGTVNSSRLAGSNNFIITTYKLGYSFTVFAKNLTEERKETVSDFIFTANPDTYKTFFDSRRQKIYPEDIKVSAQMISKDSAFIFDNSDVEMNLTFFTRSSLLSDIKVDGVKATEYVSTETVSVDNEYLHRITVKNFLPENIQNSGNIATYSFVLNLKNVSKADFPDDFRIGASVVNRSNLKFASEKQVTLKEDTSAGEKITIALTEPEFVNNAATSTLVVLSFDDALLWTASAAEKLSLTTDEFVIVPFTTEISSDKKQVSLRPSSPLDYNKNYIVNISEGLIASDPNKIVASGTFCFKTNSSDLGVSTISVLADSLFNGKCILKPSFKLSFSKPVMSLEMLKAAVAVKQQSSYVACNLVLSETKKQAILSFNDYLKPDTNYSISLIKEIKDIEGFAIEPFDKLDFNTVSVLKMISTIPIANSTGIATDTNITITFNEKIKCLNDLNSVITLKDSDGTVTATIAQLSDDKKSLIATSAVKLMHNMKYTVTINDGLVSEESQQPFNPTSFMFTTNDSDLRYLASISVDDACSYIDDDNIRRYYTDVNFEIDFNTSVKNKEAAQSSIVFSSNNQLFHPDQESFKWNGNKLSFSLPEERIYGASYTVALGSEVFDSRNIEINTFGVYPLYFAFFDGHGDLEKPFEIKNPKQLDQVRILPKAYFKQIEDIDFNNYVSELYEDYAASGFMPICDELLPFSGTYDGNDKKISNLNINRPSTDYVGLFGVTNNGNIKNIILIGNDECKIEGKADVGGIVGWSTASAIASCSNGLKIFGNENYGGGIAGKATENTNISDCINFAEITEKSGTCAGIVAYANQNCEITNCKNKGNLFSNGNVGGIIGNSFNYVSVKDCFNYGNASTTNNCCGGIIGYAYSNITVDNCSNKGNLTSNTYYCGGIAGQVMSNATFTACINYGVASSALYSGGIIGAFLNEGYITDCRNYGEINSNQYAGGIIGNGCNYLTIRECENNGNVKGQQYTGGICSCCSNNVTFNECNNHGEIQSQQYTGGILGYSNYIVTTGKCSNYGEIKGNDSAGGISGYCCENIVSECNNYEKVSGNNCVGGIFGEFVSNSTATVCINKGTVEGHSMVGGIVGCFNASSLSASSKVLNCKNYGAVSGTDLIGGISGYAYRYVLMANCNNSGDISASADYAGGIVGCASTSAKIENSCSICKITGSNYVGGLGGYHYMASGFKNCYAVCDITATNNYGALIGNNTEVSAYVSNSFTTKNSKINGVNCSSDSQMFGTGCSSTGIYNYLFDNGFKAEIEAASWDTGAYYWSDTSIWTLYDDALPKLL